EALCVDLQVFYNLSTNLTAFSRWATYADGEVTPELYANTGTGRTYGLELMLRRTPTPDSLFYGWIAYTLSRSLRREHPVGSSYLSAAGRVPYDGDATAEVLSNFDQTHIFTLVLQFLLPSGWELGGRLRLVSGNPTTPSERGQTAYDADEDKYVLDITSVGRNSGRLPMFRQLDVRVEKTWLFDLWKLTGYLELINATNAANVEQYAYDYRFRHKAAVTLLPIIPNIGIKGEF
ncbi:MAG TPA: energy transducer TonB, partial [Myxococcota bacterium]|nr:energy transducer TonB [Myxococcota bacterium]